MECETATTCICSTCFGFLNGNLWNYWLYLIFAKYWYHSMGGSLIPRITQHYTHFTHTVKPIAGGGGKAPKEKFCCLWQSSPLPLPLVPCLATGLYKVWPFTSKRSPIQWLGVLQLMSYFSHHPFRTLHDGIKALRESFSLGHNVILMLKGYLIYSVSILLQFAFNFCFRFGDTVLADEVVTFSFQSELEASTH